LKQKNDNRRKHEPPRQEPAARAGQGQASMVEAPFDQRDRWGEGGGAQIGAAAMISRKAKLVVKARRP
jgi:hypothetical protein